VLRRPEQLRWKPSSLLVAITVAAPLDRPRRSANIRIPAQATADTARAQRRRAGFAVFSAAVAVRAARCRRDSANAGAYSIGYSAQTLAFVLLVTERYRTRSTAMLSTVGRPPASGASRRRRRRLRFLAGDRVFRLPLVIPHLVWLPVGRCWRLRRISTGSRRSSPARRPRPAAVPLALRAATRCTSTRSSTSSQSDSPPDREEARSRYFRESAGHRPGRSRVDRVAPSSPTAGERLATR